VLGNKWYVDELYDSIIVKPIGSLASFFNNILEKRGIDGFVNGRQVRFYHHAKPTAANVYAKPFLLYNAFE